MKGKVHKLDFDVLVTVLADSSKLSIVKKNDVNKKDVYSATIEIRQHSWYY